MKKLILIIAIVFSGTLLLAQENCTDVIYATESEIVFNACIDKVKNGNVVHYTKNGDTLTIEAIALIKNGQQINLPVYPNSLNKSTNTSFNKSLNETEYKSDETLNDLVIVESLMFKKVKDIPKIAQEIGIKIANESSLEDRDVNDFYLKLYVSYNGAVKWYKLTCSHEDIILGIFVRYQKNNYNHMEHYTAYAQPMNTDELKFNKKMGVNYGHLKVRAKHVFKYVF